MDVSYLLEIHFADSRVGDVRFFDLNVSVFILHYFIVKLSWFQSRLNLNNNKPSYFQNVTTGRARLNRTRLIQSESESGIRIKASSNSKFKIKVNPNSKFHTKFEVQSIA